QVAGHAFDRHGRLPPLAGDDGAVRLQQLQHGSDVAEIGDVRERHRRLREQRGGQRGQRCVLGGARRHLALERHATFDEQTCWHYGIPPTTKRTIPAKSGRVSTRTKPRATINATTSRACSPPAVSSTSQPAAASHRGAASTRRRITSSPSGPPSRASRGSWWLTSGASEASSPLGR